MKLIEQSAQFLPSGSISEQIELAARTCYKSEDKITEDSSEKFVKRLIDNNHTAMLEHGTVYLVIPSLDLNNPFGEEHTKLINFFIENPYSLVKQKIGYVEINTHEEKVKVSITNYYITTNYRVLKENDLLNKIDKFIVNNPTEHLKRYSVKIITSIGIARELCRHRKFSFAQESTRYCNYSKDKFDNELTFIIPHWIVLNPGEYELNDGIWEGDGYLVNCLENTKENYLLSSFRDTEFAYFDGLTQFNLQPQQAREFLPLGLKTELVMTGFETDWDHFFKLRLDESTGKVHPDMKKLAQLIHIELYGDSSDKYRERTSD